MALPLMCAGRSSPVQGRIPSYLSAMNSTSSNLWLVIFKVLVLVVYRSFRNDASSGVWGVGNGVENSSSCVSSADFLSSVIGFGCQAWQLLCSGSLLEWFSYTRSRPSRLRFHLPLLRFLASACPSSHQFRVVIVE